MSSNAQQKKKLKVASNLSRMILYNGLCCFALRSLEFVYNTINQYDKAVALEGFDAFKKVWFESHETLKGIVDVSYMLTFILPLIFYCRFNREFRTKLLNGVK